MAMMISIIASESKPAAAPNTTGARPNRPAGQGRNRW